MSEVVVQETSREKLALALPLLGLFVFWLATVVGGYLQLFVNYPAHPSANYTSNMSFQPMTYSLLIGLAVAGLSSVASRRIALRGQPNRLKSAVLTLSTVFVIISLVTGAILAIAWFIGNFWGGGPRGANLELMRLVNVYLPIIIDAALLIVIVLRAFVFTGLEDQEDEEGQNA